MSKEEKETKKKGHGLKVFLIILLIIAILIFIGYTAAHVYVDKKINKMEYKPLNVTDNQIGIDDKKTEAEPISNFRNIAIFGIDSRFNDYEDFARTDCIMVASMNKQTQKINLFSIYRDTLAEMNVAGKDRIDKINHAYYDGIENSLKTINENYDLNIRDYIGVDFDAVATMVDEVGGIDLNITSAELKFINGYIQENNSVNDTHAAKLTKTGNQHVNGTQALAYARIRYTAGSDYKRAERMRTVLTKTFAKMRDKSPAELNKIMDEILPKVKTNIPSKDFKEVLPKFLNFEFGETFGFPYHTKDTWIDLHDHYKGTREGGDAYVIPTYLVSDVEKLHKELFDDENYKAPDRIKEIENKIRDITKK